MMSLRQYCFLYIAVSSLIFCGVAGAKERIHFLIPGGAGGASSGVSAGGIGGIGGIAGIPGGIGGFSSDISIPPRKKSMRQFRH